MKKWSKRAILFLIAALSTVSCVSLLSNDLPQRAISSISGLYSSQQSLYENERVIHESQDPYLSKIQPIFNNRCITCHACVNSPCQLNMTSFSGVDRGAIQDDIYDFRDFGNKTPTRLGIDVPQSYNWKAATDIWREKIWVGSDGKNGFHPVVNRTPQTPDKRLETSLLYQMLALKQNNQFTFGEKDAYNKPFKAEESRVCPLPPAQGLFASNDLYDYKRNFPWAGMPYGFPQLSQHEMSEIISWISNGAEPPNEALVNKISQPSKPETIKTWETFLNQANYRHQITARYLYEHLFMANIYFEDMPGEFFRLIRAFCIIRGKCFELPTRRPTDDPKSSAFYDKLKIGTISYRFQKVTSAIVHKSHVPFQLSNAKLQKWNEIFINQISKKPHPLPPYGNEFGGNPFITFKEIPAKSRYQFLLDDSYFFVNSFIKGPVCRGTGALSVIDDHFWVFFLKPDSDVTVTHPKFFIEAGDKLAVPAFDGNNWNFFELFKQRRRDSRAIKKRYINAYLNTGLNMTDIWDGDGENPNAVLTVFRHQDSASVTKGAIGESPKTMWLVDYPILEDIYYNLVATYDVYAPIIHSVKSRLHMDAARFNSQDMFLGLVPKHLRADVRAQFTRDRVATSVVPNCHILPPELCAFYEQSAGTMRDVVYPYVGPSANSKIAVTNLANPQEEIARKILAYLPEQVMHETKDNINKHGDSEREPITKYLGRTDLSLEDADKIFATFGGKKGSFGANLPELSFIQVTDKKNSKVKWYTMIHNRERYNVAFFEEIAPETDRLWPEKDSINIVKGFVGSYTNAIFSVPIQRLPEFANDILEMNSRVNSLDILYRKFLVSRHNPNFWTYFDNLNYYAKQQGATPQADKFEGAVVDLNRYINDIGF